MLGYCKLVIRVYYIVKAIPESGFFVMDEFGHLEVFFLVVRHPGYLVPVDIGLLVALPQHLS